MNVNIFILSNSILLGKKPCPNFIEQKCTQKGMIVNKKIVFPSYQPDLCNILKNEIDCINIIAVDNEIARVNEALCELTGDIIEENSLIKQAVVDYFKFRNIPIDKQITAQWEIPAHSRAIICEGSPFQGYILKGQREDIIVLSLENLETLFDVVSNNIWISSNKSSIFKTYGLTEDNIKVLIGEYFRNKDGVKITYLINGLETDILIKCRKQEKLEEYSQKIYNKLSKFIYAEDDMNIYNIAYKILKSNDLIISFAESVTGGNLAGEFIKNNAGADDVIKQSFITCSNQAKKDVLGVNETTLRDKGEVSIETAYEMALGLLKKGCDIAVATTGYAGNDTNGESYIAIGDKNTVHVYKNIFCMQRDKAIENICKAANFYLIKKLRSNDFYFEKSNV